ncbi:hypothetical protein [Actinoplanes aureus]|uniref:Uncharacterized protein n=1 Tax=Actinoplanes aureus TaxID=2792083 RepID=A0A931G1B1_9ACTN|nr:hypothetical protein [Actinoplanes aureus]MBG0562184.1 hypothetical protein [Actinoplanes aureus]
MSPFDDPFDFGGAGDSGDAGGGPGPAEPVLIRPLCRSRSTVARTRPRRRGEPPR